MFSYFKSTYRSLAFLSIISTLVVLAAMILNSTLLPAFLSLPLKHNYTTPLVTNPRTGVSYRGISANGIEHFQNIFYAEDTSGQNRFASPVPHTPPPGTVIDATAAGAWCPQATGDTPLPFTSPITHISEDCLSLRIARPSGIVASAKLPVLVWIHGGMKNQTLKRRDVPADKVNRR